MCATTSFSFERNCRIFYLSYQLRKQLYTILLLMLCKFVAAQSPSFRHYDVSNGLPTNEVYEIKQGRQGFLWIGCDAGLVRYDGNSFRLLSNKKNRGPSISGLREDKNGRIWCINFSGQVFFTEGDSLHLFEPWEKNYKSNFADIAIGNDNTLYITNFANKIYSYQLPGGKGSIAVNDDQTKTFIYTAYDGSVLYTLLDSGLIKKMIPGQPPLTLQRLYENGKPVTNPVLNNFVFYNSLQNRQTLCFQRYNRDDNQPVLYYYKQNNLYIHPVTSYLQQHKIYPSCCMDDDEGNLFIGTLNELLWFKRSASGEWTLFNSLLQGNGISFVQQDREGSLWISTLKNGIYKIPNKNTWSLPLAAFSNGVNHLATDGKELIFGAVTNGEMFAWNTHTHESRLIKTKEKRDAQALEYSPYTKQLFISQTGTAVYDAGKKMIIPDWSEEANNAKDYFFRKDGVIFITGGGTSAFFKKGNTEAKESLNKEFNRLVLSYGPVGNNSSSYERFLISEQRCKGIWYQEKIKTLWVGFVDGLTYYENKQAVKFADPESKQPVNAVSFDESPDGTLYIATVEQGIYAVKDKKVIRHYTVNNGLLSDRIKRIKLDGEYLWIISRGAVQGMNLQTGNIKTVNTTDGILSSEIFDVEVLNDTVYLATAAGIQFFPQSIETKNNVAPVCTIAAMQADGRDLPLNEKMVLGYATKNISITMEGIALKSDGKFIYQYRLLPSDTSWISVTANENTIRFSSLAPGSYVFQARVINEDGVMNDQTIEQRFTVSKPWWLQWWFLLLCILITVLITYWMFSLRSRAAEQKNREQLERSRIQEQLRSSQLSSLKAQMNPHFMFNALNSIQEFILLNDKRQANMYMGKFADLMRMTLDMSNKEEVSLEEEIKVLDLYLQLEALRFEEHFEYKIDIDQDVDTISIHIPSMLIQPYVENAVKHGLMHRPGNKILHIHFSKSDEYNLLCSISDNGIGRKRSNEINQMRQKKYTSFATGATQKRLELLNHERKESIAVSYDDLHDNNGNATGTRVTVSIPLR